MITRLSLPNYASKTISRRLFHHSAAPRAAAAAAAATPQWSGSLSYAAPESDFTALLVSANSATVEAEWSQQLSFGSSESDFQAAAPLREYSTPTAAADDLHLQVSANSATVESEWAEQIFLADAKKDVARLQANLEYEHQLDAKAVDQMLHQLQLSSPESAVGYTHVAETMTADVKQDFRSVLQQEGLPATIKEEPIAVNQAEVDRMMNQLLMLSPESALGVTHVAEVLTADEKEQLQSYFGKDLPNALPEEVTPPMDDMLLQHMLLSSPESATGYVHAAETLTEPLKAELKTLTTPLPTSLDDILADQNDKRAIVVTEATAPFRVVHINASWEGLCGYTQAEAAAQPIGDLLKGPETQFDRLQQLQAHPEQPQSALLVNYTKQGRKFHNRLQVGPLFKSGESSNVEYLVGVLQEVNEQGGMQMAS